jgi:hypothetical protein
VSSKENSEKMESYLEKHSTVKWAKAFLKDLKKAHIPDKLSYYMGAPYNFTSRLMRENADFIQIDAFLMRQIQIKVSECNNRLIIID